MNSLQRFLSIRIETLCGLEASFVIGREKPVASRCRPLLSRRRRGLFILMSNNALDATAFFVAPKPDISPGDRNCGSCY
jgi:hypothetical protein